MARLITIALVLSLVAPACAAAVDKTAGTHETTTSSSSTTTTTQPTTTTTAPLTLENSPAALAALVESFYDYVLQETPTPPPLPEPVLASITPAPGERPDHGVTTQGVFKGTTLATIRVEQDLFLVVDDGSGWRIVGGSWPGVGVPAYYGGGPRLVAVVGSDARPGQSVTGSRADSIHFVGLDGSGGGAVVGLPRDSWVPVPGYGTRKITGSLALGGPDVMMQTFVNLTGLPLEGYVLTGFSGFQYLIDRVLGGVEVEVPFAINDTAAKAALSAGLQLLDGFDALAFARARKSVPGGDFGRSEHQGDIIVAAALGVRAMGVDAIPLLLEEAEQYLVTDLTPEQLLTFSVMAVVANLEEVPSVVASGSPGSVGGASVVFLHDSAHTLFDDLADGNLGN